MSSVSKEDCFYFLDGLMFDEEISFEEYEKLTNRLRSFDDDMCFELDIVLGAVESITPVVSISKWLKYKSIPKLKFGLVHNISNQRMVISTLLTSVLTYALAHSIGMNNILDWLDFLHGASSIGL